MKAFLLAAGYGRRLKPITDRTPKCLVDINGQPLLAWWFKLLKEHGIKEVLVNTHYLAEQVISFIETYNKTNELQVIPVYEPQLLGSGGTVAANFGFVENEEDFLICYADNLTDLNLRHLWNYHKKNNGALTLALFRTKSPQDCGIAVVNEQNGIVKFEEKPKSPVGNLANGGVYVANKNIFDYFPQIENFDFGHDVLPLLLGKMYGYEMPGYLMDIGTFKNYEKAKKEWGYDYYKDTF